MSSSGPVLAFDTAMGECSVALWQKGAIRAHVAAKARNQQTRILLPLIEQVMRETGTTFADLQCIATTRGPGSFTGIRIGLATARALAFATNKPLTAITTLQLMAWQACTASPQHGLPILSAINAYRNQVYVQQFRFREALVPESEAQAVALDEIRSHIPSSPFVLAGNCQELLSDCIRGKDCRIAEHADAPCAAALAEYTALYPDTGHNPRALTPFYLRAPDAKPQQNLLSD